MMARPASVGSGRGTPSRYFIGRSIIEQSDGRPDVVRSQVGGIPVFFHQAQLPYWVGLIFRVGKADETLPSAGFTHAVEHLALTGMEGVTFDFNGEVGPALTTFSASGTADEVQDFIRRIATSLTKLPFERLDAE